MESNLVFIKNKKNQNIIYDEFFLEADRVEIIAFNYDSKGSALCRCDGRLRKVDSDKVAKILFGVSIDRLNGFLRAIYDEDYYSEDLAKKSGNLTFRLEQLNEMLKYDRSNLAKKIHRDLEADKNEHFKYYKEQQGQCSTPAGNTAAPKTGRASRTRNIRGNEKTKVFHGPGCRNYDSKHCTAQFKTEKEARAAGYKPCTQCQRAI